MNIKIILICLSLIFLLAFCSPVKIFFPTNGTVSDKTTGKPIAGATIERTVFTRHPNPGGYSSSELQIKESLTNKNGSFSFDGGFNFVFPLNDGLHYRLTTIAPGYYANAKNEISKFPKSVNIELTRLQYYLPLYYYSNGNYASSFEEGHVRPELEKNMKEFAFHSLSNNGVFTTIENAKFVRSFVNNGFIKAFDINSMKSYEWNDEGILQKEYDENLNIYKSKIDAIKIAKEILSKQLVGNNTISKEEKEIVEEINNINSSQIGCIAEGGHTQYTIIARKNGKDRVYLISRFPTRKGRRVFRTSFGRPHRAQRSREWTPPSYKKKVTACTVLWGHQLYVAYENEGIRRYSLPGSWGPKDEPLTEGRFWLKSKDVCTNETFLDLSIGRIKRDDGYVSEPVIYAVSGDSNIYRFGTDGTPDMKIDF